MATKINTEYYGAESAFINESGTYITGNAKTSPYDIWDLVDNGHYTGGAFDYTAAPWGVGECSLSSDFSGKVMKTADNKIVTDYHFNTKGNSPLFLYSNSAAIPSMDFTGTDNTYGNCLRSLTTCRLDPATDIQDDTKIISTLPVDTGNDYNCIIGGALDAKPITYLNYNKVRILPRYVWIVRTGQQAPTKYYTEWLLTNPDSSLDDGQIYQIVGFDIECFMQNGTVGQMVTNGQYTKFAPSVQSNPLAIPDILKSSYYDDYDNWVRTHRTIMSVGTWSITTRYNSGNYGFIPYANLDGIALNTEFDTPRDDPPMGNVYGGQVLQPFGQISTKQQVFDDVSYHWEIVIGRAYSYSLPQNFDILEDGDTITATGVLYPYAKLVIDDSIYETEREAYYYAIIHECAFMGFPVVGSQKCIACNIGDTTANGDVYLPVFDDHWITTGDFKTGADSLNLVNSLWGDVFSLIMPEYDPSYDPNPEPEPEGDSGDLTNSTLNRYANTGGLSQYVLTLQKCVELIAFLNGRYLPTAADLDADFKGTNPQDYIVSVQKYPFELPYELGDPNIYIGKNNTGITAKWFSAAYAGLQPLPINNKCTYDFGDITISSNNTDYCYGDFRDYQNKILLFMPFVGTAELDPRLFINHTVGLIYTIDFNTGSCVAEIKRDGLTFETHTSTISITVPFLAANMGQYQNQLAQLDYAKQLTKIKGVQTALSTAFSLGSAAQTTLAGGAPGMGQLSAITQGALQLATNATQLSQLDYQIEHTAPSVGTLSTASAANAWFMDPRARLVVVRPKMLAGYDAAQYSHVVGNACCKTGSISDFTGYTVAAAVKFGNVTTKGTHPRAATEQELQQLRRALINGAYL